MSEQKDETEQISIRVKKSVLDRLEKIGLESKPYPVKRNAVIAVALEEHAELHDPRPKGKGAK